MGINCMIGRHGKNKGFTSLFNDDIESVWCLDCEKVMFYFNFKERVKYMGDGWFKASDIKVKVRDDGS